MTNDVRLRDGHEVALPPKFKPEPGVKFPCCACCIHEGRKDNHITPCRLHRPAEVRSER